MSGASPGSADMSKEDGSESSPGSGIATESIDATDEAVTTGQTATKSDVSTEDKIGQTADCATTGDISTEDTSKIGQTADQSNKDVGKTIGATTGDGTSTEDTVGGQTTDHTMTGDSGTEDAKSGQTADAATKREKDVGHTTGATTGGGKIHSGGVAKQVQGSRTRGSTAKGGGTICCKRTKQQVCRSTAPRAGTAAASFWRTRLDHPVARPSHSSQEMDHLKV